jgi:hypothetical protein
MIAVKYSLSCNSIALELEVPCAFFSGETGDEKMPDMGSMPFSSRIPVSTRIMPVLLSRYQYHSSRIHFCANQTHRPTLPTSKYWLPVLPRRPGVFRPTLFLASFVELAADMLRGKRFSFSRSRLPTCVCVCVCVCVCLCVCISKAGRCCARARCVQVSVAQISDINVCVRERSVFVDHSGPMARRMFVWWWWGMLLPRLFFRARLTQGKRSLQLARGHPLLFLPGCC